MTLRVTVHVVCRYAVVKCEVDRWDGIFARITFFDARDARIRITAAKTKVADGGSESFGYTGAFWLLMQRITYEPDTNYDNV